MSPKKSGTPAELLRRAGRILRALRRSRAEARIELDYRSPFELLVATILSAQCTDARVNKVTPDLFRAYPSAAALAEADPAALEALIRSTGFFRAKSKALLGASRAIRDQHGGEVPRTMEDLSRLPGVGRKTANVVLGGAYGLPSGIVVDTHVQRVARRLRLTRHADPVRIERDLMALWPRSDWIFASIALVLHGRYVCVARTPKCPGCALSPDCPSRTLGGLQALRRSRDRGPD
jgi:endonuclease-3